MGTDGQRADESDPRYRCGSTDTGSGEPCGETVNGPEQRCYRHDPEHPGKAGPPGNANAVANDGGAPNGNVNALKTGEHMSIQRKRDALLDHFGEGAARRYFELLKEYRQKCANPSRAIDIAADAAMNDAIRTEFFEDGGKTTKYADDGTPFEAFDSHRYEAIRRMDKRVARALDYEGVREKVSTGGSSGHDNLDLLVDADAD